MNVHSLKRKILMLLLPALACLSCGELWLSYRELQVAANVAYDRSLAGAIKAIDASISTAGGGFNVELPYRLLEFFELTTSGKVFYRVSTEDGLVADGNADLPQAGVDLRNGVPYFYNAEYFGDTIRIGAYARELDQPLYGAHPQRVVIQVAETIDSRTGFTRGLLLQAAGMDVLLIFVVGLVMAAAWHSHCVRCNAWRATSGRVRQVTSRRLTPAPCRRKCDRWSTR
jgi:two-component system, OmpR family, sensor histidine kinase TctE